MFEKKTYNKREIKERIDALDDYAHRLEAYGKNTSVMLTTLINIMKDLQRENEQLSQELDTLCKLTAGNLGEANGCEFFAMKSYRGKPIVFHDGKLLTTDQTSSFILSWDSASRTKINVKNGV